MSLLASLVEQIVDPKDAPACAPDGRSGGASEIYGKVQLMLLSLSEGMPSFKVPDLVKATGLNRVRINRTLVNLEKKGILKATKCYDPYGRPVASIWRRNDTHRP